MSYSHEVEHSIRTRISLCFGLGGVVLLPLGALGAKFGLWGHNLGMIMVMLGFLSCLVPIALFMGFGWHPGYRSERGGLLRGMLLGLIPLCVAIYLFASSSSAPIIHDISTDTASPPEYQAILALRDEGNNSLQWRADVAKEQRNAYPDLVPIQSSLSSTEAMSKALQVADNLGWEVVNSDGRPGYIEAVDTTFWFGFKDDVVIRIQETANGSVLDIRSASRVGRGDMGANAERIRNFITEFNQP